MNTEIILNSFPKEGVKSVTSDGTSIFLGSASDGNIYKLNGEKLVLLCRTGENLPVDNLLHVSNGNSLATVGGKLELIIGEEIISSFSNVSSVGNSLTIMDLGEDETITSLYMIEDTKSIILSTSKGRILSCGSNMINAYLTGERSVYATVKGGHGLTGDSWTNLIYALYNKISEINKGKEVEKWKFASNCYSSVVGETLTGIFYGPIFDAGEDLGFWKEIIWEETKPADTDIVISLRAADTSSELLEKPWLYSFSSNSSEVGTITRNIGETSISGRYLQVKMEMSTNKRDVTPVLSKITVSYSTKQAVYFFTTKFLMDRTSINDSMVISANITEPINTEVKFGFTDKNSSNWSDYKIVDLGKYVTVDGEKDIKVGIKMVSYNTSVPEVSEFAMIVGGSVAKAINE